LYTKNDSKPITNNKVISLYKRGCELNDPGACLELGKIYSNGSFAKEDNKLALNYITKSCELKSQQACQLMNKYQVKNEEDVMCPKKYGLDSAELVLLTSNISRIAIDYCYELTALDRLQYIDKNQKNVSNAWFQQIKSSLFKGNPRINMAEINQCSKYRFKDHERVLSMHFLGSILPLFGGQSKQYNPQIASYCRAFLTQLQIQKLELSGR
jgi:TPR repeat protein